MTEQISILGKTAAAFNSGKRYVVSSGGARSSKTYSILTVLNQIAMKRKNLLISVVSETFPHLRKGAIKDFQEFLMNSGGWEQQNWNKSDSTYRYDSGSRIEFFSCDSPTKVHGPQRDILFINEGQHISYEIIRHLLIRTSQTVFIDFNPTHEFWAHTEIGEQDEDAIWIHSTYKDNPYLTKEQVKEIERNKRNKQWWRVYGEGKIGQLEGLVFPEITLINELPGQGRTAYGLDFGYTNDPASVIKVMQHGENLYLHEEIYQTGLSNAQLAARMKARGIRLNFDTIYADSAEPKSIDDLHLMGWNVKPAVKGKDSIMYGIDLMRQSKIHVTKQSVNLIKEFRNYSYEKDKNGQTINKPIDGWNHGIDAARYAVMMMQRQLHEYKPLPMQEQIMRL